jgi:uncharacterized protein (DUF488 family)
MLLVRHGIEEVVDVRSAPYSRYAPQFNHINLEKKLETVGLSYTFLGDELGGRPADRSCYSDNGRVLYDRVAGTDLFGDGVRRIIYAADERRVALMCTEKEPLECHRALLVARTLAEREVAVEHILADGRLESHASAMDRLIGILRLPPNGDMFRSRADVIADAVTRQARKVAYVGEQNPVGDDYWEHTF